MSYVCSSTAAAPEDIGHRGRRRKRTPMMISKGMIK